MKLDVPYAKDIGTIFCLFEVLPTICRIMQLSACE